MNTSATTYRPNLKMSVRAAAMLGLSLMSFAAAMAGQPQTKSTISEKVSIAGLDLSTPGGMSAARGRVQAAARRLCFKLADSQDLSRHENYVECVNEAVTGAMLQIGGPVPSLVAQAPAKQGNAR